MVGLIDIGSNTVRLVIYEKKRGEYVVRHSQKEFLGILNYVKEGKLSREGLSLLCRTLGRMKKLEEDLCCKRFACFATASLRGLENQQEVLERIKGKTGLEVQVLSGEREAECGYLGLRQAIGPAAGAACDLGGGSCQIFTFDTKKLLACASLPLGSLRLTNRFQQGEHLTGEEARRMERHIKDALDREAGLRGRRAGCFYVIGGAGRAMAKVHRHLTQNEKGLEGYVLPVSEARQLAESLFASPKKAVEVLSVAVPERERIFLAGAFTLIAVAGAFGAELFQITRNGVREGALQLLLEKGAVE